jgi:kynureninase
VNFHELADQLDETDPLGAFRCRFVKADPELIYWDGNSLGMLPKDTVGKIGEAVSTQWGERLIRGWGEGWLNLGRRCGDKIATIIGANPGEVIVCDSTSVNFFKLTVAALQHQRAKARPLRVVTDTDNFPSDLYLLQALTRFFPDLELVTVAQADEVRLEAELQVPTALLTLSHTSYRTAAFYDMARLNQAAHRVGALTLWDLSHSAGSVPLHLERDEADLAVGCNYKYLNGGPGAPAYLYVRESLQAVLDNPIQGWFGHSSPFAFQKAYEPAPNINRMLTGTPAILSTAALEPSLDLILEAGMTAIRQKSIALTSFALTLAHHWLEPYGFVPTSEPDAAKRGSHIALAHPEALRIDLALINQMNVIPDFRPPDTLRIGLSPLTTSFSDVAIGMSRLVQIMANELYLAEDSGSVKVP